MERGVFGNSAAEKMMAFLGLMRLFLLGLFKIHLRFNFNFYFY